VVAVLDGCTDDSEQILRRLADSRFVIVCKERNEGHVRALNTIHAHAQSEFIARFDADDLYHRERLARQVEFLRVHPEIDVLGTRFDYVNAEGSVSASAKPFPLLHSHIKRDFQRYTAIGGPTCIYRRARISSLGDYSEEFNHVEDLALWLACLAAGYKFANLPEVLVHYRVHDAQASQRNYQRQLPQLRAVYERYGRRIWGGRARPWGSREPRFQRLIRRTLDLVSG
jgi:glycosyltransferase involved in cell wall biosynthesis